MLQANQEENEFIGKVEEIALILYARDVLRGGKAALPSNTEVIPGVKAEDVSAAMEQSRWLLAKTEIRNRICPGLLSVSDDIKEVSKVVGAAMFPLSLIPASTIPLTPLVVAAIAIVILRAGIQTVCGAKAT
jgi:hypothetical protein